MKDRLLAAGADFENRSAALAVASTAAIACGAIEIPRRVLHNTCVRVGAVRSAAKVVQDGLAAGGIELEDGPITVEAAELRGAVEVAGGVRDQAPGGIPSIVDAVERVERAFIAAGINFEYSAAAGDIDVTAAAVAAEDSGSVEIAGVVAE